MQDTGLGLTLDDENDTHRRGVSLDAARGSSFTYRPLQQSSHVNTLAVINDVSLNVAGSTASPSPGITDPTSRFIRTNDILGRGAYKEVYKAFDQNNAVQVAWNQLRVDHLTSRDAEKILSEIRILQSLECEHVIKLLHAWADGNGKMQKVYFITEWMTSGTLKEYIQRTPGPIRPKVVRSWCRQILQGLTYLHSREPPIIHRDLKCENVFVNGNTAQAKIGDLGLATARHQPHMSSVLGTPEFMAPEYYDECYTEKVDVYAFGLCVLEMVTKEYPYSECTNAAQIFRKVTTGVKPLALSKVVDRETKGMIEWCIETDPVKRPSAQQLLEHPFFAGESADLERAESISLGPSTVPSTAPSVTPSTTPSLVLVPSQCIVEQLANDASSKPREILFCMRYTRGTTAAQDIAPDQAVTTQHEIKFPFHLDNDTIDEVVNEMIRERVLSELDRQLALNAMQRAVQKAALPRTLPLLVASPSETRRGSFSPLQSPLRRRRSLSLGGVAVPGSVAQLMARNEPRNVASPVLPALPAQRLEALLSPRQRAASHRRSQSVDLLRNIIQNSSNSSASFLNGPLEPIHDSPHIEASVHLRRRQAASSNVPLEQSHSSGSDADNETPEKPAIRRGRRVTKETEEDLPELDEMTVDSAAVVNHPLWKELIERQAKELNEIQCRHHREKEEFVMKLKSGNLNEKGLSESLGIISSSFKDTSPSQRNEEPPVTDKFEKSMESSTQALNVIPLSNSVSKQLDALTSLALSGFEAEGRANQSKVGNIKSNPLLAQGHSLMHSQTAVVAPSHMSAASFSTSPPLFGPVAVHPPRPTTLVSPPNNNQPLFDLFSQEHPILAATPSVREWDPLFDPLTNTAPLAETTIGSNSISASVHQSMGNASNDALLVPVPALPSVPLPVPTFSSQTVVPIAVSAPTSIPISIPSFAQAPFAPATVGATAAPISAPLSTSVPLAMTSSMPSTPMSSSLATAPVPMPGATTTHFPITTPSSTASNVLPLSVSAASVTSTKTSHVLSELATSRMIQQQSTPTPTATTAAIAAATTTANMQHLP